MLQLKDITKQYTLGENTINALKGVSLDFRKSEFVAILGPSGCGKTTLLNIIGGLDSYTSGDLLINKKSTQNYNDASWDAYRNHSIGFVFQSYNLIPHQTVLSNVEIALKISGVSKRERRKMATEALEKVGLGDQINKKPNTLSGGQMQRVAIARALVNDPDIILADEPTGALDSETSVQIMDILKEVASDRLVIMVTHNPELADAYATRIIRLKDGEVIADSHPMTSVELASPVAALVPSRAKLGFGTALGLSLNNLLTKKGRTILTSFAGAIGIIGIALILALSNGMNDYISSVESDVMGSYPIELEKETIDLSSMMSGTGMGGGMGGAFGTDEEEERADDAIYSNNVVASSVATTESLSATNDLGKFKTYLEDNESSLEESLATVEYGYDIEPQAFRALEDEVLKVSPTSLDESSSSGDEASSEGESDSEMHDAFSSMRGTMSSMGSAMGGSSLTGSASSNWEQLVSDQNLRESHYELLEGSWPTEAGEVGLIISGDNEISDYELYTLGLMDINEMNALVEAVENDEDYNDPEQSFSYSDALGLTYQVFAPAELYAQSTDGVWLDKSTNQEYLNEVFESGITVTITCVLRAGEAAEITSGIAYTAALTEQLISLTEESAVVKQQLEDPDINVFTGEAFEGSEAEDAAESTEPVDTEAAETITENSADTDMSTYAEAYGYDTGAAESSPALSLTEEQLTVLMAQMSSSTPASYEEVLEALGYVTLDQPDTIALYPVDFEAKTTIEDFIAEYNDQVSDEADRVTYTDMIGMLTSSITSIVDTISYILIAFVAISLIVSSIMIAIITYISVLERTKEIGVLRALGASKGDVSKIFNAETFIEGLISGVFGIAIALLLCIPINLIISSLIGVEGIAALPLEYSLILIAISVALTLIAGFIPARLAAKKDPVVALRTE